MMRVVRALASGAAILAAASCCESPISPSSATGGGIVQLAVVGDNELLVGEKSQLQAIATFEDGTTENVTSVAQWASTNGGVCAVTGKGATTGVAAGGCVVTAVVRDKNGGLPVTVIGPGGPKGPNDPTHPDDPNNPDNPTDPDDPNAVIAGLAVQGAASVGVGQTTQWTAVAVFTNGTQRNVTSIATWSSGANGIASVAGGLIQGVSPGTATITASYKGKSGGGPIQVTNGDGPPAPTVQSLSVSGDTTIAVGESAQWQAIAQMSDGTQQNVTGAATWSSGSPSVASVVGGLVSGQAEGSSLITATYNGQSDAETVQVSAGAAQLVGLELQIGAHLAQFASAPFGAGGRTFAASGRMARPMATGTSNITMPLSELLNGNPILDLTVFGLYSDGSKKDVTSASAVSTDDQLITMDQQGAAAVLLLLLQGLLLPDHYVNATYGGYTGNANINVELPEVTGLAFNSNQMTLGSGNQLPSLEAAFTQGLRSGNLATSPEMNDEIDYEAAPASGPVVDLINTLGLGGVLNQLASGLGVVNGALSLTSGATSALNSLLGNPLIGNLINTLPEASRNVLKMNATVQDPVTHEPVTTTTPLQLKVGN